jgi:hypothetical protein
MEARGHRAAIGVGAEPRSCPDRDGKASRRGGAARGSIMPETRDALLAMGVGAGFFVLMYEWVTMIANAMP